MSNGEKQGFAGGMTSDDIAEILDCGNLPNDDINLLSSRSAFLQRGCCRSCHVWSRNVWQRTNSIPKLIAFPCGTTDYVTS
jgi:hypothetical protein